MKNANLIVILVLAAVLLSGTFISLVAAANDGVPDPTAVPDPTQTDSSDNSTSTNDGEQLYTIQDNRTTSDGIPVPSDLPTEENPNLIATQTPSDNTLSIVAIAIVLAIIVGAVGVFFYRKKSAKA
jgi:subtilase family serine protease